MDPPDVAKMHQIKRSLENKLDTLTQLDGDILDRLPEGDIEADIVQADEISERIYEAVSKIELALKPDAVVAIRPTVDPPTADPPTADPPTADPPTADPPTADPPTRDPTADPPTHASVVATTRGAKVRLTKISLPQFHGDPVKWTSF